MTTRRLVSLLLGILSISLLAAACVQTNQLGERPAPDVLGSVEIYLQRYQPGPEPRVFQTTRVTDRHGDLLGEFWEEGRRTWLPLDRISQDLIDATIATEDASFYNNAGIDPARIAGAAMQNVQEGEIVSGASTITMQLARNLFLGADDRYDQTMDRKMLEAGLAQELSLLFGKDEVLEMYLNLANYGHLAYGPEAAAQVYFGKPAKDLTLAEATLLAGIPQQPANFDLFKSLDGARARQRVVLDLMVRHGYLTPSEANPAYDEPVHLIDDTGPGEDRAPHFLHYLETALDERLGDGAVRRGGYQITTTLDLKLQDLAQTVVAENVAELKPRHDLTNGALVATRPQTGEILAMVGSADFDDKEIDGQVNVAISPRQPGSAIKPILYATAFDENLISPATILWDIPVTFTVSATDVYTPTNYDEIFHGPVTARSALANSYNIPAVKLLDMAGVENMLENARAMGADSLTRDSEWYGLSLTLGGGELTLLDLTKTYSTLANRGRYVEPRPVLSMRNSQGKVVDLYGPTEPKQVVSPAAAFLVTDILSDNVARTPAFSDNSPLKLSKPAAAKTGTTSDWRDNWTLGYTPYLVAGVWAGNSDGHPMKDTSGLTGAAPIWHDFMEGVVDDPALMARIGAPFDETGWQFNQPEDVLVWPDPHEPTEPAITACPPGAACREGGELFTREWLEIAELAGSELGPLADSVDLVPTAPVFADQGEGSRWTAFCQAEPAVARAVLTLPNAPGLPIPTAGSVDGNQSEVDEDLARERLHATAWSLRNPTAVDLGPCDALGEVAPRALALMLAKGEPSIQVLVDMAAAMDPNVGVLPGGDAIPVASIWSGSGSGSYSLAQPIEHHHSCPGNYILGQVLNAAGGPVAGVHVVMEDQWGNRADAVSKSGGDDFGHFDFPLNHFSNRYTLTIVDASGNQTSAAVVIDHLPGNDGDPPCHTVVWREN
ncbi:MAG: transglycosylase domain-containing protein [Chloroflexota bacterium]|nr:transglycosylase domain-containing protein [Chloroflexota bacterium]